MTSQINSDHKSVSTPEPTLDRWQGAKPLPLIYSLIFASILWLAPIPHGLDERSWHLFVIFITTILAIILKPLPMGALALLSLACCVGTKTLTLNETLGHFNSSIVWLVVFAFYIARGFIKTGLGARVAYWFIAHFGHNSLGLAYSLILSEFILAPAVPSNTARGAGIIFPIAKALSEAQGSFPDKKTRKHLGAFLMKICFQANVITSALFVTAFASNPMIVSLASDAGITISWWDWAMAAIIPGILNLLILPWVVYYFCTPDVRKTPEAPQLARQTLRALGPLRFNEIAMILIFFTLLILWVFGSYFAIESTTAALYGVVLILMTGILKWEDILKEKAAWDTLIWFATLIMMASFLTKFGFIQWFGDHVHSLIGDMDWHVSLMVLTFIYFYTHYFFASGTAHASSMYSAFLIVALATGVPPMLAAMSLAICSSLCGGLTHYGTGAAPVFYGAGYLSVREWWVTGGIVSIVNLMVWFIFGGLWWKTIGLW